MKKAIIVGASSGMGKELAKILVENTYTVGVIGRRETELLQLQAAKAAFIKVSSYDCTIANNEEKLTDLVNQIGGLDLLILSSGTGDINEELDYEIEHRTNQLNVIAFTEIVTWAFKYFEKQGTGHLVAISSIAGIRGSRMAPAYNASKAYQINYLEGLRQKASSTKQAIFVTDIRPGFVDTDMAKGEGQFWVATKEKAAKQIFALIQRKQHVGYVTKRWRLIAVLLNLLPNWLYTRM